MSIVADHGIARQINNDRRLSDVSNVLSVLVLDGAVSDSMLHEWAINHVFATSAIDHSGCSLNLLNLGLLFLFVGLSNGRELSKVVIARREVLGWILFLKNQFVNKMSNLISLL